MTLIEALERRFDAMVAGTEAIQLLEVTDGPLGVASKIARRHGGFPQEVNLLGRVELHFESSVVQGKQFVPTARGVERQFEPLECPGRRRAKIEHALQELYDAFGIVEPLLEELDHA